MMPLELELLCGWCKTISYKCTLLSHHEHLDQINCAIINTGGLYYKMKRRCVLRGCRFKPRYTFLI